MISILVFVTENAAADTRNISVKFDVLRLLQLSKKLARLYA